jgi:nucleoside-diphosphate-sugar epimerase
MIKVAITSIGSGVGQSVVDSCRNSQIPMEIFGLGMNPFAFGAFDCDHRLDLPTIYSDEYVDKLLEYCKEFNFDIVIPGLDDELILLSERINEFNSLGIAVPVASPELIKLCRDKGLMSRELLQYSPSFIQSFSHEYIYENTDNLPYPLIAKPNSGFASRNIFAINSKKDLNKLEDFHVVQTLAIPKQGSINRESFLKALEEGNILQVDEISVQLLYDKNGYELGRMASCNKLQNGVPIEIIPIEDSTVWDAIDSIISHLKKLGLYGPINIQGRLTDDEFKVFEINPRFTGITGLRSLMGFNEVEAIIKNYCNLESENSRLQINHRRIGIRQVTNRVIDIKRDEALYAAVQNVKEYPKEKQNKLSILVTGANGYLGLETIEELIKSPKVGKITALVRNAHRFTENDFFPKAVEICDINEFKNGNFSLGSIDIVCHLASGREVHSQNEIASSLEFTNQLMISIAKYHVPALINMSSQAVYGQTKPPFWSEDNEILPETSYAQSKWAGELMTKNTKQMNNITSNISLRLAQFIGPSKAMAFDVVAHIFCKKAILREPIHVQGGNQKFDYVDIRDVTKAIAKLIEMPHQEWPEVLNIGSGKQITLLEIVQTVSKISKEKFGKDIHHTIEEKEIKLELGMNIDRAKECIDWKPTFSIEQTIANILDSLKKEA